MLHCSTARQGSTQIRHESIGRKHATCRLRAAFHEFQYLLAQVLLGRIEIENLVRVQFLSIPYRIGAIFVDDE